MLRRAGYDVFDESIPGAVVAFDDAGKNILLTAEAKRPSDYVDPIVAWIESGTKVGRYLEMRCSSCQQRSHQFALPGPGVAFAWTETICASRRWRAARRSHRQAG